LVTAGPFEPFTKHIVVDVIRHQDLGEPLHRTWCVSSASWNMRYEVLLPNRRLEFKSKM
jgi:hypothetical protein